MLYEEHSYMRKTSASWRRTHRRSKRKLDRKSPPLVETVPQLSILPGLAKQTHKDLVSSRRLKEFYVELLPSIKGLIFRLGVKSPDRAQDMKQSAMIAIWDVLSREGNNPTMAAVFGTIKKFMIHTIRLDPHGTDLNSHNTQRKYKRAIKDYRRIHGREPTALQLAEHMNISILYVDEYLMKRAATRRPLDYYESPMRNLRPTGAWWYARKERYENKLIYWIDRHWVMATVDRLDDSMKQGITALMSEESTAQWARRQGLKPNYTYSVGTKGLWYCRLLAELKFKLNDPKDPRQYLQERGYKLEEITTKLATKFPAVDYYDERLKGGR